MVSVSAVFDNGPEDPKSRVPALWEVHLHLWGVHTRSQTDPEAFTHTMPLMSFPTYSWCFGLDCISLGS